MKPADAVPPERQTWSLQARLLATVLALLVSIWLLVTALTWYGTRHELDELLDAHLAQAAALLVTQRLDDLEGDDFLPPPTLHKYQSRVAVQVWHEGQLVVRSTNAPAAPLAGNGQPGLSTTEVGGQRWRVLTTPGREADVMVHVGETIDARNHILMAVLRGTLGSLLLGLPLLALGIWWAVRGTMRPLRQVGRDVAARRPAALDPLPLAGVPPEVRPLVESLNELFGRMVQLLESERRFTADAAHELRTPVAAIRMQAQVAQGARSQSERDEALAATVQGCDRAARLIDQLLQLARLEGEAETGGAPAAAAAQSDLRAVAQGLLGDMASAARARGQSLELVADIAAPVPVPAALVAVLLRNLLDNALRYSPEGATVRVTVCPARAGAPASLSVEDSGPGLSPEAQARLGERFFRVLGTGQSGSGLGWSIVARLARLFGLSLETGRSDDLGGLRVTVKWPSKGDPPLV